MLDRTGLFLCADTIKSHPGKVSLQSALIVRSGIQIIVSGMAYIEGLLGGHM